MPYLSHRFLTAEEGFRSKGSPYDICGGHCGRFLSKRFVFPLLIIIPPLSDIYLSIARGMQNWPQFQETYFTAAQGGDACKTNGVVAFISHEM